MPTVSTELDHFLDALTKGARPGDRVPTVRDLMGRFGVSQSTVQQALGRMKSEGLIESRVGRGTSFKADGRPMSGRVGQTSAVVRSVLLLRRSVGTVRAREVMDGLQRLFVAEGHRVLEVAYTDSDHARTVLRGLPRFDACMIQTSFETITIETLAAVRQKTEVVAVDGAALIGTEVDAVGLEWGEPVATAIDRLMKQGHRGIACATTSQPFLANELGRRRIEELRRTLPGVSLQSIILPLLPQDDLEGALATDLKQRLDVAGRLPFTALVAWGIDDGARFRKLLSGVGLAVPAALSVVLLGRADLVNEHADFFDVVGCNAADQISYLHQAIVERWAGPARAYGIRFLPVVTRAGASIATVSVRPIAPLAARRGPKA